MSENTEIWKPVVGFEGWYEVSNLGRVKRVKKGPATQAGRILKLHYYDGYTTVRMSIGSKTSSKAYRVHVLVAEAFICPKPDGLMINHKDGVRDNNVPSNLEWVTHKENMIHAIVTGLRKRKITPLETHLKIVDLLNQTNPRLSKTQIAQICGVSHYVVKSVAKSDNYLLKSRGINPSVRNAAGSKILPEDVEEIKQLLARKILQQKEIARIFNVHPSVITLIKQNKYYGR